MMRSDTIAAIATARGRAALAIVRLSGPQAVVVASRCFHGRDLNAVASHTVHVGAWRRPGGEDIDQVVATVFRAPRSATGEDVVEVSCHGGDYAASLVLESSLECGARLAEPGEFTQRAFLRGKIDLAQAEAVADLIHASSKEAHRVSVSHLQGRYSKLIGDLRETLLEVCALAELEIDFAEEDVEFADRARLGALLETAEEFLSESLASYQLGELVREGVRVAIGGRPNAGKSTLLNALLGRARAIVSAIPGTTRDAIEADREMEGLLFRFIDTAGLHETSDAIEAEGVRRAKATIDRADLLLYVYDLSIGLDASEIVYAQSIGDAQGIPVILVGNKTDLLQAPAAGAPGALPSVLVSARESVQEPGALEPLRRTLVDSVVGGRAASDASRLVTNQRHREHIGAALRAVRAAAVALETGMPVDVFTLDIRAALHELGAITGAITNEDVLSAIFSRFCIGK